MKLDVARLQRNKQCDSSFHVEEPGQAQVVSSSMDHHRQSWWAMLLASERLQPSYITFTYLSTSAGVVFAEWLATGTVGKVSPTNAPTRVRGTNCK